MSDLAKRLLACPRFRWMRGMYTTCGVRLLNGHRFRLYGHREDGTTAHAEGHFGCYLPDLTDPATLGCLLALVREVRGQPNAYARLRRNPRSFEGLHWEVLANAEEWRESALGHGSTEAAALVAALEAP